MHFIPTKMIFHQCSSSSSTRKRRCKKRSLPNLMQIFKFYVLILIVLDVFYPLPFFSVPSVKCRIFIRISFFVWYSIRSLFWCQLFFCIYTLNISDTHFNMHILMWNIFCRWNCVRCSRALDFCTTFDFHSRHSFQNDSVAPVFP